MVDNKDYFIKHYNSLVQGFKSSGDFSEINCKKEKIKWPKTSGVYVIWKGDYNSFKNLVYVGMTGKFKRVNDKRVVFNSGSFNKRKGRWMPYRFCESAKDGENRFEFRYGPKKKKVSEQGKIKYRQDAYEKRISYSLLKIHCFHISKDHREYTPELLEKEILTKYFKSFGNLPPANNEI